MNNSQKNIEDLHAGYFIKNISHLKRDLGEPPRSHSNPNKIGINSENHKHKHKSKHKTRSSGEYKPKNKSNNEDKQKSKQQKHINKSKKSKSIMKKALKAKYQEIISNPLKYHKESKWIAPPHSKGVKYVSYLGSTGYADAARGYIRSLAEIGVNVFVEALRYCDEKGSETLTEDDLVLAICLHNKHIRYDTVIIHSIPSEWDSVIKHERKINPNVRIFGLTVWETDRIDENWMKIIMDYSLTGLIVPSQWNCQTFIDTSHCLNFRRFPPVYVCRHAIVDRVQKCNNNTNKEILFGQDVKLALLCIGTWTCRKGIEESIRAYLTAFKGRHDVVLYVKTSDGPYTPENSERLKKKLGAIYNEYDKAPRIILDTNLRSDEYLDQLTENCDVYLSLCNSEGVGLGACQTALKGRIIVMTGYGGQIEYIKEANWVNHTLDTVKVPPGFAEWIHIPQKWGYPSLDHAVQILQNIYQNKDKYLERSKINRNHIMANCSYLNIGRILKEIVCGGN